MSSLAGKNALVTGASRGIGRAIALSLGAAGARVIVHYSKSQNEAEMVVADICRNGGRALCVRAELGASEGPHRLAEQVRALIGDLLDILVANAAVSLSAPIAETTLDAFDNLFAVNVRAPYFLVQQLIPALGNNSSVVFVSSLAAHTSINNLSAYAATKGAIETLVKHFAAALGPTGIRVNAVAPGVVQTEMSSFTKTDAGRAIALGMQSLKRIAEPDDIASVVAFLASDAARWITGDILRIDGGSKL